MNREEFEASATRIIMNRRLNVPQLRLAFNTLLENFETESKQPTKPIPKQKAAEVIPLDEARSKKKNSTKPIKRDYTIKSTDLEDLLPAPKDTTE